MPMCKINGCREQAQPYGKRLCPDHSTLDEVLEEFQNFLRACGYVIEYNKVLTIKDMDQ